jgi:lactate permease
MGTIVSITNIVAVCSILGLVNQEGFILKRAGISLLVYGLVAGLAGLMIT